MPAGTAFPHLYSVESKGNVSFIFGTIHTEIPLSTLPPEVIQSLKMSRSVAGEIDTALFNFQPLHILPDFPEVSFRARKILRRRGIPDDLHTSAHICSFYLNWSESDQRIPYMDLGLEKLARALGKPYFELDREYTIESEIEKMGVYSTPCDIELLTQLVSPDEIRRRLQNLRHHYRSSNAHWTINCVDTCSRRTRQWIPKLEELHNAGGVFAFFGAAHLYGPDGAIEHLRNLGYRVTPVRKGKARDH